MTTTRLLDTRGCAISGATPAALQTFERALAAFQGWRSGTGAAVAQALEQAPGFVMAHALQAWLMVGGRDPRRVRAARPVLAHAARLPANDRERAHLAALGALLDDNYEGAKAHLGALLRAHPRDVLALQVAHALDHVTGEMQVMHDRIAAVLPAWGRELPGHAAVLAMHAFSLEECGAYAPAEHAAHAALALDPGDARAHHVLAHVFEMTGRADAGMRWLEAHRTSWAEGTVVATHVWWHLALFELARGEPRRALDLYDHRIRADRSADMSDLIDAAALLWRLQLHGAATGTRWAELAAAWAPHIDDRFCSFSDVHAMLAFVGAGDWASAQRLERVLASNQSPATRHGQTTRQLGLPAVRALSAFGRGDDRLAIRVLASLPGVAHRMGGSHAQRDVLRLTLLRAVERTRRIRPARRSAAPAGLFERLRAAATAPVALRTGA